MEAVHAERWRSFRGRKLRTVMVCHPGSRPPARSHQAIARTLLFDDVIWVQEAQKDHYDFVSKMKHRGVEVLELHDLLARSPEV